MSDPATTGLFTLAGTIVGAVASGLLAILNSRRQMASEDRAELLRQRRAVYVNFLDRMSSLEVSIGYVFDTLSRDAGEEIGRAKDASGVAYHSMRTALEEMKLVSSPETASMAERAWKQLLTDYQAVMSNNIERPIEGTGDLAVSLITAMRTDLFIPDPS